DLKENILSDIFKMQSSSDIATYIQMLKSKKYLKKTAEFINEKKGSKLEYEQLSNMLHVFNIKDTRLIRIECKAKDKKLVSEVVNTLIGVFIKELQLEEIKSLNNTEKFLKEREKEVLKDLKIFEEKYKLFKNENRDFVLSDNSSTGVSRFASLKSSIAQTLIDLDMVEKKISVYKKELEVGKKTSKGKKTDIYLNNPAITKEKNKLSALSKKLEVLKIKFGRKHPKIIELKKEISLIRVQIKTIANKTLSGKKIVLDPKKENLILHIINLEAEREGVLARQKILKKELISTEKVFNGLPENEVEFARILRNKKMHEEIYIMLQKRSSEVQILKAGHESKLEIVDTAEIPKKQLSPDIQQNTLMGFLLSVIMGLTLAFAAEYFGKKIEVPEEAEKIMGVTTLGIIPKISCKSDAESERGKNLVTFTDPKSKESEAYRILRTNIQFLNPDKPVKNILVSSSLPKEGKSVTLANLAVTFAQASKNVLVVDTDMRKPVQHKIFGIDNDEGLTNLLIKDVNYKKYIKKTDIPNLFLLPTGPIPPNPAEFLNSNRMQEIMDTFSANFDYIFYDSPPVVMVTDAAILSTRVDGLIYVINIGEIPDELLMTCKKNLDNVNARILGLVFNKIDLSSSFYGKYYSNYYYSYYNYYYSD
ncbi:polysaccharide biosynthesis tyrosine autokinase, partial [bacterium]|nr:polysaccharide biosynthesis tyrosine autokinase [bacterium]